MIEIERACMTCGKISKLNTLNIKSEWMHTEEGERYKVMYYTCPQCKSKDVLQVDNEFTLGLKQRSLGILLVQIENGNKGRNKRRQRQKKYDDLSKRLKAEREKLEIQLSGKTMYNNDGEIVIKHLTVNVGSDIIESKM